MLKICLVEDEEYALKSLHQKILDLNGPYEVVGVAYDGVEAIDIVLQHYPDVVLTDIRMPDMDGIALIEYLSEQHINTVFVIVSGYQEFEYAKQALKLGVEDYLLKPVAPNELSECLAKCDERVRQRRNNHHIDTVLSNKMPLPHWGNVEYFLVYMILGNALPGGEWMAHPDVFYLSSHDIERRTHSQTNSPVFCFIGVCGNEKAILIERESLPVEALLQVLEGLAAEITAEYQCAVTISYQAMNPAELIGAQISLCRKAAHQNALLGANHIVCGMQACGYATRDINGIIADFALLIRQWQLDSLIVRIEGLLAEWEENRSPLRSVQMDLLYITKSLKHAISAVNPHEFTIDYYIENMISISNTYADLSENFTLLIIELFGPSQESPGSIVSPGQLVEQIDQYFRRNLSQNLTLSMLCAEMNYSKVYLCRVFKKMKNSTPIDYFLQLKMEKAKSLLAEFPAMPMKDIAESLGFNDVYYFSKVFKRIIGFPPSRMRK